MKLRKLLRYCIDSKSDHTSNKMCNLVCCI